MTINDRGKGHIGCLVSILLFIIAGYLGYKVIPPYFNAKEFETQLRNEGIKAVNRNYTDEAIVKDVLGLANGFEIPMKAEDIKIRRFGTVVDISVAFDVPIVFEVVNYTYWMHFSATSQSRSVL